MAQTRQIKALTAEVRMLGGETAKHNQLRRAESEASASGGGRKPVCGASTASPASSDPFAADYQSAWPAAERLSSTGTPYSQSGSTDPDITQRQFDARGQAAVVDVLDISSNTSRHFMPSDLLLSAAAEDSRQAGGACAAPAPVGSPATAGVEQAAAPRPGSEQNAAADGIDTNRVTPIASEEEADSEQQHGQANDNINHEAEPPETGAALRAGTVPDATAADSMISPREESAADEHEHVDGSSWDESGNSPEAQSSHAEEPALEQPPPIQQDGGLASPLDVAKVEVANDDTSPSSSARIAEQSSNLAAEEHTAIAVTVQAEDAANLEAQAGEDSQAATSAEPAGT